ncbi:MAG: SGNH/GDSL hydrolase family protein [Pedococcus sp.]
MTRRAVVALLAALALLLVGGGVVALAGWGRGDSAEPTGSRSTQSARTPAPTSTRTTSTASASPDTAGSASPAPGDAGSGYYLALGDSLAAGFQLGVDHRTKGYAGPVRASVQKRNGATALVNLGCSGETTSSMLDGGTCSYAEGSQLKQAEQFLREHADDTHLVTLDIGGNDVARCGFEGLKAECTKPSLATLSTNLPKITRRLRAAAPDAQIVLLNYYDPFLVLDLVGSSGLGQKSVAELAKLNAAIDRSAKASGATVADVAAAFQTAVMTPVAVKDVGIVPTNLARILQWTWMAAPRFDFHANDAGYAVMAKAVEKQLR